MGNFSLCLRCHNGGKATNIKQYYEDEDKNEIIKSGHTIIAIDGSYLNGNLPCAECHETHGSKNLVLLRNLLGHENQQEFSFTSGDWANKERDFCLKCHNSKTKLFGVTGLFNETLTEHLDTSKACSECHGGTGTQEVKALRAAHAPVILKKEPTLTQSSSSLQTESPKRTSNLETTTLTTETNEPIAEASATTEPIAEASATTEPTAETSATTDKATETNVITEPSNP
ncbi:hypothetical protein [Bacillus sp. ISL-77]|uniref:multiheme c-type cytochrome n=1 Tax=Bacillus sp. ISL-77 TaxID=2819138 RepID=UPI0035A97F97